MSTEKRIAILLKASLGTGKTTQSFNAYNKLKPKRSIFITSRRLFARSVFGELKKYS